MSKKEKLEALIQRFQAQGIKIDWCGRFQN